MVAKVVNHSQYSEAALLFLCATRLPELATPARLSMLLINNPLTVLAGPKR
jgi:hypothetical protein